MFHQIFILHKSRDFNHISELKLQFNLFTNIFKEIQNNFNSNIKTSS